MGLSISASLYSFPCGMLKRVKKASRKDVDWHDLSGKEIVRLLSAFPLLVNNCDLKKLSVEDWADLLCQRSEFKCKCKHLQKEIEYEIDRRRWEEEWQREMEERQRESEWNTRGS